MDLKSNGSLKPIPANQVPTGESERYLDNCTWAICCLSLEQERGLFLQSSHMGCFWGFGRIISWFIFEGGLGNGEVFNKKE